MSHTPRKFFWPKRWVRSFAGAALATGLIGSAVWAADPVVQVPAAPTKDAPKLPDVPKLDAPLKVESPKADPKAEPKKDKLITFTMSDKPWKDVIEWYANETGLAFNSVVKPPDGSIQFTPPKDPKTGQ